MADLTPTVRAASEEPTSTGAGGPEISEQPSGTATLASNQETWKHLPTPEGGASQRGFASRAGTDSAIAAAEHTVSLRPSAENFLQLSLEYYNAGRFNDCVSAARHALKLRPNYAEAYNNIAAGYQGLHDWDASIDALRQALRIKPNYPLAKNNLALSQAMKRKLRGN